MTKSFHKALQGTQLNLFDRIKRVYLQTNDVFFKFTHLDHDCVIICNPQALSLTGSFRKSQPWIWRCRIDLANPHKEL
ncbi:MAG: hypothetical protein ACYS67_06040 [Planctomycetota bacterium]